MSAAPSRRGATLGRAFVVLFCVSTLFPIVAGLLPPEQAPSLLGLLDVGVATVVLVLGFTIESRSRANVDDTDRAIALHVLRLASTSLLILLGIFFLAPGLFRWEILLVGLAWRAWLLIWVLPSLVASLRQSRHTDPKGRP